MQAIILAAGMGKRLKDLTKNNTKCMIKVNGETLIERTLKQLDSLNLDRIIIVVGYQKDNLINYINTLDFNTNIIFVNNEVYDQTNNIYSLYLARDFLVEDDTLLLESDIIFENSVLEELVNDSRDTLAVVDKYESWMDGTVVTLSEEDEIIDFVSGKNMNFMDTDKYYKTVNIYKFSKEFSEKQYVPFLYAYSKALGNNEYYEQVLRVITLLDNSAIRAKRLNNQLWYEIDDACDLDIAESLFLDGNKKLDAIKKRYGGYWRYTRLVDFCYLVNPYYPPKRMFDEIKNNFDALVTQYPSGADVISLIASRNFGVDASRIVVGNGAAELINIIMKGTEGKIGFIRPTFEEYPNRCDKENAIVYEPKNDGFRYSADDIIEYFQGKDVKMVVLINPDNPSGNYIQKSDVLRIAKSLKSQETIFLVDESFVDFCDYDDSSLLDDKILEEYNNLLVVKSISKSYGVPGLRIGIVATSHKGYIDLIKKEVSIWNINSFAEYYLQISSKYANDYSVALNKFKESRKYLEKELAGINYITPYSSQANYILCKLENGVSAEELTAKLLNEYNIYIKDLSSKISTGEYVRIAVRDLEDNAYLIDVLKELEKLYD